MHPITMLASELWIKVFAQTLDNDGETPVTAAAQADLSIRLFLQRFAEGKPQTPET